MKVIIFTVLTICCASVKSFHMESKAYEDFPNNCSDYINLSPFVRVGQKYYLIEGIQKLSWFGAAHVCRAMDANLAIIETEDGMQALSQHLVSLGYTNNIRFWIAGNDLTTENKFQWLSTGKPMNYTKWFPGQPDNAGNEDCVHIWRNGVDFYMNDWSCDQKAYYICEANTPKTIVITTW